MKNIDLQYITDSGVSFEKLKECLIDEGDTVQDLIEDSESMGRLETIIEAASGMVNGYCRARYSEVMPWESDKVPETVKDLTLALAKPKIFGRRNAVDEEMEKNEKNALQALLNISKGHLKLEIEIDQADTQVSENTIRFTNKSKDDLKFGGSDGPAGYLS